MDFNHSEDRQMLADTLGRYLQQRYPIDARHAISGSDAGWSAEHWSALAELGIIGALFGEGAGGFGGTGFDIAVVFEQLGKALVVEPFLGTLMAGRVLAGAGGHEALLGEEIAGTAVFAFAHEEARSRYDLAEIATCAGDGWTLTGIKAVVPQIAAATHLLVTARISGWSDSRISVFDPAGRGFLRSFACPLRRNPATAANGQTPYGQFHRHCRCARRRRWCTRRTGAPDQPVPHHQTGCVPPRARGKQPQDHAARRSWSCMPPAWSRLVLSHRRHRDLVERP
ncbi:hypothetical protein BH10PSE15_BH10PSE15_11010 [soil metagenome]